MLTNMSMVNIKKPQNQKIALRAIFWFCLSSIFYLFGFGAFPAGLPLKTKLLFS
jgi:hypothetical protein